MNRCGSQSWWARTIQCTPAVTAHSSTNTAYRCPRPSQRSQGRTATISSDTAARKRADSQKLRCLSLSLGEKKSGMPA